ncbi:hypothetical protein PFISCL1PPCAC_9903 [Pristionchus fissidentatus]|uniref:Pectate lyase n=1 Tax=Pristionchus fissidentatus TaxID=1538716 RepID=A0AAV5VIY9_9BILA|nr:hypothetical protein PFISCL1PPCAC_9903 [Pristionchus fissidentatus]
MVSSTKGSSFHEIFEGGGAELVCNSGPFLTRSFIYTSGCLECTAVSVLGDSVRIVIRNSFINGGMA